MTTTRRRGRSAQRVAGPAAPRSLRRDDITRREFLIGAGLIVLATSCGERAGGGGEEGASEEARTIDHKYGTTEIRGVPERVVTVGLTEQEYETLSEIAPTVAQPGEYADFGAPWQEIARLVGRALGRAEEAEGLIPDIEGRFERARERHPEFEGATGILATDIDGAVYIYAEGPAPRFLRSLGLALPPAAAELFSGADRAPVQLSLERLDVLEAADVLVMGVYGDEGERVADKPVYGALDVAREGRDVFLPEMSLVNGALTFSTVLSLPIALDGLVPRLAAAIDGDPDTDPAE